MSGIVGGATPPDIGFTEKAIDLVVALGTGDSFTLSGLRVNCIITNSAPPNLGYAKVQVFGVAQDTLNAVANINNPNYQALNNTLTILAGTPGNTSQVWYGSLWEAFLNFDAAPETCLELSGHSLVRQYKQASFSATSIEGKTDAQTVIQNIMDRSTMTQDGWTLENQGVDFAMRDVYIEKSPWTQIAHVAKLGNFYYHHDDVNLKVYMWPKGQTLNLPVPTISPAMGMIGYPQKVQQNRIKLKTLFNNNIQFGQAVMVEGSEIVLANGMWQVYDLEHEISAQLAGGPWFSTMQCWSPNIAVAGAAFDDSVDEQG